MAAVHSVKFPARGEWLSHSPTDHDAAVDDGRLLHVPFPFLLLSIRDNPLVHTAVITVLAHENSTDLKFKFIFNKNCFTKIETQF